jgi:hypothetical protein
MLSESARMNTAAEAQFRVSAASESRAVAIVAMDAPSERVVARLASRAWNQATFLNASAGNLLDNVASADLVVMVATPGTEIPAAPAIGAACSARRVMTTALVTDAESASEEALSRTLAQLRPWSLMVVVADADQYIEDVLSALRA